MSSLDNLMNLQGAAAAFEYSDRGELTEHRISEQSNLTPDALDLLAHVFVANISIATMQARGWEKTTGQGGFYPVQGFTLVGLEWSAVGNGRRGVVLRNDKADYEAAYAALDSWVERMIKQLLALDGVSVVCQFRDDGALVEGYGVLGEDMMERLARFAHDYKRMVQGNTDQFSMFTQLPGWTPPGGWIVRGETISVCSVGNLVCFIDNSEASLNEVMKELAEASRY